VVEKFSSIFEKYKKNKQKYFPQNIYMWVIIMKVICILAAICSLNTAHIKQIQP
jgi:hypothetical protein